MRLHSGEKPFACRECGAKFAQFVHLKLHKRQHSACDRPLDVRIFCSHMSSGCCLKHHMSSRKRFPLIRAVTFHVGAMCAVCSTHASDRVGRLSGSMDALRSAEWRRRVSPIDDQRFGVGDERRLRTHRRRAERTMSTRSTSDTRCSLNCSLFQSVFLLAIVSYAFNASRHSHS